MTTALMKSFAVMVMMTMAVVVVADARRDGRGGVQESDECLLCPPPVFHVHPGPLASTLVGAANRYGQTALHLVARRGSVPLLHAMLRVRRLQCPSLSMMLCCSCTLCPCP